MFWLTFGLVVGTLLTVAISYFLLRVNLDPRVIVYARTDTRRPTLLFLVIENIGRGVAKNIRFATSRPLPARAFGFGDAPVASQMTTGPLVTGIPSLEPGGKRVIIWGQFGGLDKALRDSVIRVTATFDSDAPAPFQDEGMSTESLLEVKSFEHTDGGDKDDARVIAEAIEKIAVPLNRIVNGSAAISVRTSESAEHD